MIVIKWVVIKEMPEDCSDCIYFSSKPHPAKGWTDSCELMMECMDDDADEGWQWGGDQRPLNCPLIEIKEVENE